MLSKFLEEKHVKVTTRRTPRPMVRQQADPLQPMKMKKRSRNPLAAHAEGHGVTDHALTTHGGPQWSKYPPAAHRVSPARRESCDCGRL